MSPSQCVDTLRAGVPMGADRGIHVKAASVLYPLAVSKILKSLVEVVKPGLLFLREEATDDDCNHTGQMVAGLLYRPRATFASKVVLDKERREATVDREVDGRLETLSLDLPAVTTYHCSKNLPKSFKKMGS